MNKSIIASIAALSLLIGAALSWAVHRATPPEMEVLRWLGDGARAVPAFEFFDHRGGMVTDESLKDQWSLVFFGYTFCPDICAGSMLTMSQVIERVEANDIDNLQVYFFSIDPYRDTPEIIENYVSYFNEKIIGATASEPDLRVLTGFLGIMHEVHRESEDDTDYLADHSGHYLLFNPDAEFTGLFSAPHDADAISRDLIRTINFY